jgi:hypothetical protein
VIVGGIIQNVDFEGEYHQEVGLLDFLRVLDARYTANMNV